MKSNKTTNIPYNELQVKIMLAREALNKLIWSRPWCHDIVDAAITRADNEFKCYIDALIEEINSRDCPMTECSIREIFEYCGYTYNDSHIAKCRPESEKQVADFIREEYYE